MIDFKAEAWRRTSLTTSPCALETIVVMELAPHSWQKALAHRKTEIDPEREGGGGGGGGGGRQREAKRETQENTAHLGVHVARFHEEKQRANVLVGFGLEQVVLHHLERELDDGSGILDALGR